jgi:hypothetical protein
VSERERREGEGGRGRGREIKSKELHMAYIAGVNSIRRI